MLKLVSGFIFIAATAVASMSSAHAQDAGGLLKFEPDLTVKFDGGDPAATQTARRMYGKDFRLVEAKRIWLKDKDDGYEQMAVRLSTKAKCTDNCTYAILFYDDRQWLELWRGTVKELQLGPVGDNGLRGIYDGHRMWSWTGHGYWPNLSEYKFDYRPIEPAEQAAVDNALARPSGVKRDDTQYSVLDLPLKEGKGALVSIQSLYYCGQGACHVFVLDKDRKVISELGSIEAQAGLSPLRDQAGNPLIELVTLRGVAVYRYGDNTPFYEISEIKPVIAGRRRQ